MAIVMVGIGVLLTFFGHFSTEQRGIVEKAVDRTESTAANLNDNRRTG